MGGEGAWERGTIWLVRMAGFTGGARRGYGQVRARAA